MVEDADVASVMNAYNRVNVTFRGELGTDGDLGLPHDPDAPHCSGNGASEVTPSVGVSPVEAPPREFAGFQRVTLDAGDESVASLTLTGDSFANYDEDEGWTDTDGSNRVHVARSERDIVTSFEYDS